MIMWNNKKNINGKIRKFATLAPVKTFSNVKSRYARNIFIHISPLTDRQRLILSNAITIQRVFLSTCYEKIRLFTFNEWKLWQGKT